ncbi:hypothetical protein IP79_07725 [Porphyrobacter sp. AAP60]|nr:hypothetical protein IP79_07725 [Porphyrobacter sp. AAP60]
MLERDRPCCPKQASIVLVALKCVSQNIQRFQGPPQPCHRFGCEPIPKDMNCFLFNKFDRYGKCLIKFSRRQKFANLENLQISSPRGFYFHVEFKPSISHMDFDKIGDIVQYMA